MARPMNPASVVFPEWNPDVIEIRAGAFAHAKRRQDTEPPPPAKRRGWQPAASREPEPPVIILAA